MFPKAVLHKNKRGQMELQAYNFSHSLILRWKAGERESLWRELPPIKEIVPRDFIPDHRISLRPSMEFKIDGECQLNEEEAQSNEDDKFINRKFNMSSTQSGSSQDR